RGRTDGAHGRLRRLAPSATGGERAEEDDGQRRDGAEGDGPGGRGSHAVKDRAPAWSSLQRERREPIDLGGVPRERPDERPRPAGSGRHRHGPRRGTTPGDPIRDRLGRYGPGGRTRPR